MVNGLNTDDLALNTSRSRRRKDSQGRFNGRSSSSEENSPIAQRRNKSGNSSQTPPSRGGGHHGNDPPARNNVEVVATRKNVSREVRKKRGDSFVLDIGSIMSELQESGSSHTDEEDESSVGDTDSLRRRANGVQSPVTAKLDPPPPPKDKTRKLQTEVKTKTILINTPTTARFVDTAPSSSVEKAYPSRSARSTATEDNNLKSDLRDLSSSNSNSRLDHETEFSKGKPPVGPIGNSPARNHRREGVTYKIDDAGSEDRVKTRSKTEDVLNIKNRTVDTSEDGVQSPGRTAREIVVKPHDDDDRIRRRANALEGKRQNSIDKQLDEKLRESSSKRDSDQFDDNFSPSDLGHRARAGSSKDVKRSGSFNKRRQMSGDKALEIFYHNRRSQMLDHDEETGLERSGSHSSPQSPVSARASKSPLRSVRDSGEFSQAAGLPMSPLLSSSSSSDVLGEGLGNMRRSERAERAESAASGGGMPLSPRIVVNSNEADNTDVSGRVG